MSTQIESIAVLAYIDERLDELKEEFGDLPQKVAEKEKIVKEKKALLEETEGILSDIKEFIKKTKVTLVELKDKEEKLSKQQFQVRNNKEFDAITSEIAHIQHEHEKLVDKMRTEGVKEENLTKIMENQYADLELAKKDLDEMNKEVKELSGEQNEELNYLQKKREKILKEIKASYLIEYDRIRTYHKDAAVRIIKNSCNGTVIPSQLIVEVRNNKDEIFVDEHSGRILIPEEIVVDDSTLEKV